MSRSAIIPQQSYYIPKPTLTPANIKTSHIVAIIHYLRTVIDLPKSQYIIVTVEPENREFWTSVLSSVLLVLAAIGILTMYIVDGLGNAIDAAIDGAERVGNGLRKKFYRMAARWIPVRSVYFAA